MFLLFYTFYGIYSKDLSIHPPMTKVLYVKFSAIWTIETRKLWLYFVRACFHSQLGGSGFVPVSFSALRISFSTPILANFSLDLQPRFGLGIVLCNVWPATTSGILLSFSPRGWTQSIQWVVIVLQILFWEIVFRPHVPTLFGEK